MLKLAEIFQSNMVLQRDKKVVLWGTAEPEADITVSVQNHTGTAHAGADGGWMVKLPPLHPSEQETVTVSDGKETLELVNIAVGEVWIAGGQSNMEFHMRYEKHLSEIRTKCANPRIRFFDVPEVAYEGQKEDFDYSRMGFWRTASEEDIEYFSAVGYYFGRELEKSLDVPVGIVGCNWGGTHAASWMKEETVRQAGAEWLEESEEFFAKESWDEYLKRSRKNPMFDRGNPFEEPFSEFVMPKSRTPEELAAFFAEQKLEPPALDGDIWVQNLPGSLYEHMVKTIAPYTVRGVLWYQGESDDVPGRQKYYRAMLTGLIQDWRELWQEDIPFLIVQLPGFGQWLDTACIDYDTIREAQKLVTESVADTWLCSISDAGEENDIHPKDKQVVGERLALLAKGHIYGQELLCDPPIADGIQAQEGSIRIHFKNAGGGLQMEGNRLPELHIECQGKTISVKTDIEGDCLVLYPDGEVRGTVSISYAKGGWYSVSLYNKAGIPAVPFLYTVVL